MFGKDELAREIRIFLEENGIDPFYAVTIFCIAITLSYWKDFKNWNNLPYWIKGLSGTALFGAIVFSIISLLRLFGIIEL